MPDKAFHPIASKLRPIAAMSLVVKAEPESTRLSGYGESDIGIEFIGLRPGQKTVRGIARRRRAYPAYAAPRAAHRKLALRTRCRLDERTLCLAAAGHPCNRLGAAGTRRTRARVRPAGYIGCSNSRKACSAASGLISAASRLSDCNSR